MPFEYMMIMMMDFSRLIYNKLEKKMSICQEKGTELLKCLHVGTSPRGAPKIFSRESRAGIVMPIYWSVGCEKINLT